MTVRELVVRARGWRTDPLVLRVLATPPGRLGLSLYDLNVRERALTLAGQAFLALVPLAVVAATWFTAEDSEAVGDWIIDQYDLGGATATAVEQLFDRPPDGASGIWVVGLVILLMSVNSFARNLQRTYEVAWALPHRAPRRTVARLVSLVVFLGLFAGMSWVIGLVARLPLGPAVAVGVQVAIAVPGWLLINRLLLSARVPWHLLVPGATLSAAAQLLCVWAGAIYMPHLIERNAERYGVIGVAVALASWLMVLAFVIVLCAGIGSWAGRWYDETRPEPQAPEPYIEVLRSSGQFTDLVPPRPRRQPGEAGRESTGPS